MTAAERLTRRLVDLATEGRRPRCGEAGSHGLWLSDDAADRAPSGELVRRLLGVDRVRRRRRRALRTVRRVRRPRPDRRHLEAEEGELNRAPTQPRPAPPDPRRPGHAA